MPTQAAQKSFKREKSVKRRFGTSAPTEYLLLSYIIPKNGNNINILIFLLILLDIS